MSCCWPVWSWLCCWLVIKSPNGLIDWVFPHGMTVEKFINDCLMVVFFFTVGLEIKREVVCGQLSSVRKAILPVLAAAGGMIAPALILRSSTTERSQPTAGVSPRLPT